ncbi:MAG: hypothetical protein N2249_01795 [Melioribacter sp.]|nr:hypothetical protein [Melioribacter sp.]
MKKSEELILKYLADLMNDKEKEEFEKELETSLELRNSFESINKIINEFSEIKNFNLDDRYFATLLPKVHDRLDKKTKFPFARKLSYVIPAAIAAILIITLLPSSQKFDERLGKVTQELINYYTSNDSLPVDIDDQLFVYQKNNNFEIGFLEEEPLPKDYINKYLPVIFEEAQNIEIVDLPEEDLQALYINLTKFNY